MSVPRGLPEKPQIISAGGPLAKFNTSSYIQKNLGILKSYINITEHAKHLLRQPLPIGCYVLHAVRLKIEVT